MRRLLDRLAIWWLTRRPATPALWLKGARQHLDDLATLGEDWDGYGAAPQKPELQQAALAILECYARLPRWLPIPTIVPTCNGGVQLEVAMGPIEFELETKAPLSVSWLFDDTRICGMLEGTARWT